MGCAMCGKCCQNFSVPGVGFAQLPRFLEDYKFLTVSGVRNIETHPIPIFNCSRLVDKNGSTVCSHYDQRPKFCRAYPETQQKREVGCTL